MRACSTLTALLLLPACTAEVGPSALGPSLPVASLSCPAEARAGEPFVVDGSASQDLDGPFAEVSLRVQPGDREEHELSGSFTLASSGVATASLVVVDGDGNRAEARCRVQVRGTGTSEPSGPGAPLDLSGDFALVAYDRPELSGGALDPARQCAAAPELGIVHLEHSGTRVSMTVETCDLTLPNVQVLLAGVQRSTVREAALAALPVLGPIAWELEHAGAGASFAPPPSALAVAQVIGAAVDDASAALPTDAADALVTDDDHDGEPGVTIESSFGPQLVVLRRVIRAMSGVIVSADEIDGANEGSWRVDSDSSLLSLLGFLVPTGAGLPSTFGLVRVDGKNDALDLRGGDEVISCGDVRAAAALLQERVPAPALPQDCPSF